MQQFSDLVKTIQNKRNEAVIIYQSGELNIIQARVYGKRFNLIENISFKHEHQYDLVEFKKPEGPSFVFKTKLLSEFMKKLHEEKII